MQYFVVTRRRGPSWNHSLPMREQDRWAEHATVMNGLAAEGFVVLGGPLGTDQAHVLLVVSAASAEDVRHRLTVDPWTSMNLLPITTIQPWQVLL